MRDTGCGTPWDGAGGCNEGWGGPAGGEWGAAGSPCWELPAERAGSVFLQPSPGFGGGVPSPSRFSCVLLPSLIPPFFLLGGSAVREGLLATSVPGAEFQGLESGEEGSGVPILPKYPKTGGHDALPPGTSPSSDSSGWGISLSKHPAGCETHPGSL